MSKKNQKDDNHKDSLNDEQDDTVNQERELEQELEEESAQQEDTDSDLDDEQQVEETNTSADQGFDQQAPASSGSGMAGTAMAVSLLALAGTGYNWYDAQSLKSADQSGSEQVAAVDYSADIASIQSQIESLTQSQEELSAMAADSQASEATEQGTAEAEDSSAESEDTAQTSTDEQTSSSEQTMVTDSSDSSESEEAQTEQAQSDEEIAAADTQDTTQEEPQDDAQEDGEQLTEQESEVSASDSESQVAESQSGTDSEVVAEVDSQAGDESHGDAEQTEDVAEVETTQDTEAQMTDVAAPSAEQIKQIAQQQVGAVLEDAKKRLGLSEVAQLLSIGEQRLALADDVGGAQTAFSLAEQRLSSISDTDVEGVKETIAANIRALGEVEVVDKNALTQELNDLSAAVNTLEFKPLETLASEQPAQNDGGDESNNEEQASEPAQTSETQESDQNLSLEGAGSWLKSLGTKMGDTIGDVGSGIAGDLKDMVRIQKTGPLSDVVLAPEQQYFIRENVKLMLGGAQRAVLQGNSLVFQQNLDQSSSLVTEFFDTENEEVQHVINRLDELGQVNLEPELPDISGTSASVTELLKQLAAADETNN